MRNAEADSSRIGRAPRAVLNRSSPGLWTRCGWTERVLAWGLALHLNLVLWVGGGTLLWAE